MTPARYSRSAIILHWLIAGALAFQFGLGEALEHLPKGKAQFDVAQFHKSIGLTILLLTVARIAIRLVKPRPAMLPDKGWAQRLASITHFGLYAFMIVGPLTGWLMVSTSRSSIPTYVFGTIPWPHIPFLSGMEAVSKHNLHELAEDAHGVVAKIGMVLFLLHVVGALRHQWLLKEPLIERMVPARRPMGPLWGSALIVALAAAAFGLLTLGKQPEVAPEADARLMGSPPAPVGTAPAAMPVPTSSAEPAPAPPPPDRPEPKDAAAVEDPGTIPAGTAPKWAIAPGGRLGFASSWSGSDIAGSFGKWSGDIQFNPAELKKSSIRVTIDLASVASGDGERDAMLTGADFFNVAANRTAVWTSGAIRSLGGNRYRADGTLSLRGMAQPVPLDFTLDIDGRSARAKGSASLKRTAFGVGQGDYAKTDEIPDAVGVRFDFRATRS